MLSKSDYTSADQIMRTLKSRPSISHRSFDDTHTRREREREPSIDRRKKVSVDDSTPKIFTGQKRETSRQQQQHRRRGTRTNQSQTDTTMMMIPQSPSSSWSSSLSPSTFRMNFYNTPIAFLNRTPRANYAHTGGLSFGGGATHFRILLMGYFSVRKLTERERTQRATTTRQSHREQTHNIYKHGVALMTMVVTTTTTHTAAGDDDDDCAHSQLSTSC